MTPQDAPAGPVLGEDERAALIDALVPLLYSEWDDGAEVGKVLDVIAPVVASLLSSAREEGRKDMAAVADREAAKCDLLADRTVVLTASDSHVRTAWRAKAEAYRYIAVVARRSS